jgi:hypothetical protein
MLEQKKYALVTFLFDGYDLLREPLVVDDKFDYYCLTDDKDLKSDTFKCIYIEEFDTDKLSGVQKTYMAKYSFYKYLPSGYEYYFTIDASIEVAYKLYPIVQFMESGKYEVGLSMHPDRSSWRDEYMSWMLARGLDRKYVKAFNEYAESLGLDPNKKNGLIECTVKLYKNSDNVISFIDDVYKTLGETNNFEDKNGVKHYGYVVMADNVGFGGSKQESSNAASGGQRYASQPADIGDLGDFEEILSDGDTPF